MDVEIFVAGVFETLLQVLVVVLEKDDIDDKEGRGALATDDEVSLSVLGDFTAEVGVLRER